MATQSSSPPTSAVENPTQPPAAEAVQQANGSSRDVREAVPKQSPSSVFVNSEPMREEQVQNAVKFLSHPKVRGSPVMYRRSFLERKGVTKEEIDEAFRRVPDPPPSSQATTTTQEGQVKTTSNVQQAPQPVSAIVSAPKTSLLDRFHWYHAVLAMGLLSASGAGAAVLIKNAIIPRVKSWIRKIVVEEEEEDLVKKSNRRPSLVEEAAAAAKSAAAAAADVAKAIQEIVNSNHQDKRSFEELMKLLYDQVKEMKSLSASVHKLEATSSHERFPAFDQEDHRFPTANSKLTYVNGKTGSDTRSGRSSSPPVSAEPSVVPHSKSYMEIMAMVQRGEKPPNVRDINDQPLNPNQPISNPRIKPRAKPWEIPHAQNGSSSVLQAQLSGDGLNFKVQDNGLVYQSEGENVIPWWQRKNPRITEIENEDENGARPYGGLTNEQPIKRRWVPQRPPVVMPEAAEAIRRPKPSAQKDQSENDQILSRSTDIADELQRATALSESAGVVEIKDGESVPNSSEIQEAHEHS